MKGDRDMKAKIIYKDPERGTWRRKTIEVEVNDVCLIVREFIKITKLPRYTYISKVRCGRYEYQWNGDAKLAAW